MSSDFFVGNLILDHFCLKHLIETFGSVQCLKVLSIGILVHSTMLSIMTWLYIDSS